MDNENLLNSIYQNIAMVLETIPEIRKITTDCDFKALIISQEEEYQNLSDSIKDTITSNGDSTEELNDLLKTYSEWMTKLKAMSDKNVSHLSEMCIQGYTMGMIKAIQKNHLYCDVNKLESISLLLLYLLYFFSKGHWEPHNDDQYLLERCHVLF